MNTRVLLQSGKEDFDKNQNMGILTSEYALLTYKVEADIRVTLLLPTGKMLGR